MFLLFSSFSFIFFLVLSYYSMFFHFLSFSVVFCHFLSCFFSFSFLFNFLFLFVGCSKICFFLGLNFVTLSLHIFHKEFNCSARLGEAHVLFEASFHFSPPFFLLFLFFFLFLFLKMFFFVFSFLAFVSGFDKRCFLRAPWRCGVLTTEGGIASIGLGRLLGREHA